MHSDVKPMGRVIRNARESKLLTQAELAEKIDVSLRTIIAVENGKRNPTYEVLNRLVHALNIPGDLVFRPSTTAEQAQFIREYLNAPEQGQRIVMESARIVWRELYDNNEKLLTS